MVDDLMLKAERSNIIVSGVFVGVDNLTGFNRVTDMANDVSRIHNAHHAGGNAAPAIGYTDNGGLASRAPATLAGAFTADIRFVRFALAKELTGFAVHQLADFMGHAPCSLVGHPKLALQFFRGHTIAGSGHEKNCKEPRNEAGAGLVKDCASRGVKLETAPRTGIGAAFRQRIEAILFQAFGTLATFWPALLKQKIQTSPIIGELTLEVF